MASLGSVLRGFAAEVRPVPMALCLATVVFGSCLAAGPVIDWNLLTLVLINAFLYLYTAHLNDTMFDVIKGEYEKDRELHTVRVNDEAYLPKVRVRTGSSKRASLEITTSSASSRARL